jgi:phospholipid/cholesterol/gamma-HCH transport system substrate-binding protein
VQLLAATMDRLQRGEGTVGRLLADDRLVRELEATAANARTSAEAVPQILARVEKAVAEVEKMTRDLARATPEMPKIARNVEETSDKLPMLLLQARSATAELQQLVVQLRGHWLLGGSPDGMATHLPPTAVRP